MLTHGLSETFNSLANTLYVRILQLVMAPARAVSEVAATASEVVKDAVTDGNGTATGRAS
jgi:hypothetical protein